MRRVTSATNLSCGIRSKHALMSPSITHRYPVVVLQSLYKG